MLFSCALTQALLSSWPHEFFFSFYLIHEICSVTHTGIPIANVSQSPVQLTTTLLADWLFDIDIIIEIHEEKGTNMTKNRVVCAFSLPRMRFKNKRNNISVQNIPFRPARHPAGASEPAEASGLVCLC